MPCKPTSSSNMPRKTTSSSMRRTPKRASADNQGNRLSSLIRHVMRGAKWILPGIVIVILVLRFVPPPTSAFMLVRYSEGLFATSKGPSVMYSWRPMRSIPPHMALAVVAAEDQNFPNHFGFDVDAIARALDHNTKNGKIRGASTISQQVAKNLFLWSGRSYVRKALEAGLTVLIELLWSKERILEVYLNIAEFGDGTYGVDAAARRFFGKSPDRLNRYEASLLASVLPNPKRFLAQRPSPYVMQRANWVQNQMHQLGPEYLSRL